MKIKSKIINKLLKKILRIKSPSKLMIIGNVCGGKLNDNKE